MKDPGCSWSPEWRSGEEGETGVSGRGLVNKRSHVRCSRPLCHTGFLKFSEAGSIQFFYFNRVGFPGGSQWAYLGWDYLV